MRRLFADAFYWIGLLHAGDKWHHQVVQFTETLEAHHLYTTDAVFDEYLATYSARACTCILRTIPQPDKRVVSHPLV